MLVADGGPAHHWQAVDRHGQAAGACTACSYTPAHKLSTELMWSMVHNSSSKARWGPVGFADFLLKDMMADRFCDYNGGLPHKASWHVYITLAGLTRPAGECF